MIYRVLHKPLSKSDWNNRLEGESGYFYETLNNFSFIDISDLGLLSKIEKVLNPLIVDKYDISSISPERYIKISSLKDFKKNIFRFSKNDLFVFQISRNMRVDIFVKLLNKLGFKTLLLNYWQTPSTKKAKENTGIDKITKFFYQKKRLFLMRLCTIIHDFFYHPKLTYDFALCGGEDYLQSLKNSNCKVNNVIAFHSISYDEYLSVNRQESTPFYTEPYMVFVDQAITIHPEFTMFKPEDTEKYRKEIIKTLKYLEEKYGKKIIVAEHPRVKYPDSFWQDIMHIQGHTPNLIKYCDGVIGHFSGSINLAHLFNKPLKIFLTSSSKYFYFKNTTKSSAMYFGGKLIDMSNLNELDIPPCSHSIKEAYSLCPDSLESNKEKLLNFFSNY